MESVCIYKIISFIHSLVHLFINSQVIIICSWIENHWLQAWFYPMGSCEKSLMFLLQNSLWNNQECYPDAPLSLQWFKHFQFLSMRYGLSKEEWSKTTKSLVPYTILSNSSSLESCCCRYIIFWVILDSLSCLLCTISHFIKK